MDIVYEYLLRAHTHTQTGGQVENIMHRRPIRWAADKNQR